MIVPHIHACGHVCGCALPNDPLCCQDALLAQPVGTALAGLQAVFAQRWTAAHPHPDFGTTLPPTWTGTPVPGTVA